MLRAHAPEPTPQSESPPLAHRQSGSHSSTAQSESLTLDAAVSPERSHPGALASQSRYISQVVWPHTRCETQYYDDTRRHAISGRQKYQQCHKSVRCFSVRERSLQLRAPATYLAVG